MNDFWYVFIVVLLLWNMTHAYKGIWDLTRCDEEIATWRNIFDLILSDFFASAFAVFAVLEKKAWLYIIFFIINECLFMVKIDKYKYLHYQRVEKLKEE